MEKVLLAKLEEEEGGQDLAREQLRGVILVLGVVLIDAMVVGRGGNTAVRKIDTVRAVEVVGALFPNATCHPLVPSVHERRESHDLAHQSASAASR